jgi:hypothetical protein
MGLAYFVIPWISPSIPVIQIVASLTFRLTFGFFTTFTILYFSRVLWWRAPRPWLIVIFVGVIASSLSIFAMFTWPNSADEYGYNYLADTLLDGRFWNLPTPDPKLFQTFYIAQQDGKVVSQYPPGWPCLLAFFKALKIGYLANAILTCMLGIILLKTLKLIVSSPPVINSLIVLVMLSPFVLFNGASYFSHTAAALFVMMICWLQMRDEIYSKVVNKIAIGVSLSILLTIRYEVFLVTSCVYVIERIASWKKVGPIQFLWIGIGATPATLCLLFYNWKITGNPLLPVETWADTGGGIGLYAHGIDGFNSPVKALIRIILWASDLCDFASPFLVGAYIVALILRVRSRTTRFFDYIFPGMLIFFIFYPDFGGFQYGPRYWFVAFPPMTLTIAAAFKENEFHAAHNSLRRHFEQIAVLQLIVYFGFSLGYAMFLHQEFKVRRAILLDRPPALPALVLISDFDLRLSRLQWGELRSSSLDFTRNGVNFSGQYFTKSIGGQFQNGQNVIYGRDLPGQYTVACSFNIPVFIWHGPSIWQELKCNA